MSSHELIGIVGAGRVGRTLARLAVEAGISVVICNSRHPRTLGDLARELGPLLVPGTLREAVFPELVIIAVPWAQIGEAVGCVADWEGRIVLDPTNPPPAPGLGGRSSSEIVADLLPGARVVKAFNSLRLNDLAAALPVGGRRVVFLAGDHERSRAEAARLIAHMGFAALDLGGLSTGGRLMQNPGGTLGPLDLISLP